MNDNNPPPTTYGYGQPPQQQYNYGYGQPQQGNGQSQYSSNENNYGNNNQQYAGGGGNHPATDNMSGNPYDNHMQGVPLYNSDNADGSSAGKNKFVVQGCKDVWAAVLFLLMTIAVIVWGIYMYASYFDFSGGGTNSNGFFNNEHSLVVNSDFRDNSDLEIEKIIMWAAIGVAAGLGLAVFSLGLFYCIPKVCIIGAFLLSIGITIGCAIWAFINGVWIAGALLLFAGLLQAFFLYVGRRMIPFSAALLKQSSRLIKSFPAITFLNFLWMVALCVWALLLMGAVYPTIRKTWIEDSPNAGLLFIVYLFTLFASYWTIQVVYNISHVTTCGVAATWYYCGNDSMPSNPTLHSAKRALTTSFGSICFGSLLVALIQTVRALFRVLASNRNGGGCCVTFCFCIIDCILGCIQRLFELFNKFAFVFVAIYGCSYLEAARKTMGHVKTSPFAPLFNNALVTTTLTMFALVFTVMMAVIAFFGSGGTIDDIQWASCVLAFICAAATGGTMWLFFHPVDSICTAIYVCLAEEPNILAATNPEFNSELRGEATKIESQEAAAASGV